MRRRRVKTQGTEGALAQKKVLCLRMGGGGGVPFYKAFKQLKGPQGSRRAAGE